MSAKTTQQQKITTKLNLSMYTLFLHLQDAQEQSDLIGDKELRRLLDALIKYVDDKLALPDGDIEDTYVVVEQLAEK